VVEQESTRFYMLWPPLAVRATSPVYLAAVLPRPSQQVSLSITHRPPAWLLDRARGRSLTPCAPGIHVTQSRRVGRAVRRSCVCRAGSN
jgi:hypothetical protein